MDRLVLNDAQWDRISGLIIGRPDQRGSTGRNNRMFVEGVLWVVRTGSPWRDLPEAFGDWNTVFRRFSRWSRKGVWQRPVKTRPSSPAAATLALRCAPAANANRSQSTFEPVSVRGGEICRERVFACQRPGGILHPRSTATRRRDRKRRPSPRESRGIQGVFTETAGNRICTGLGGGAGGDSKLQTSDYEHRSIGHRVANPEGTISLQSIEFRTGYQQTIALVAVDHYRKASASRPPFLA